MELRELNDLLSAHTEEVCRELMPNGKKHGHQWVIGSVAGEAGDSMAVELTGPKAGLWFDHAANEGGDLLNLVQKALNFRSVGFAAKWARDYLNLPDDRNGDAPQKFDPLKFWHFDKSGQKEFGTKAWPYHDADGNIHGYVVRFERVNSKGEPTKDVLPLRFSPKDPNETDRTNPKHWAWKGWTGTELPPIYNLHRLHQRPDAPVLIVEGEKTADAAAKLFPDYVAITWQGGCARATRVDLTPLRSRDITLWPDNDTYGDRAMQFFKGALPGTKIVTLPPELPEGWDLADPVPDTVSVAGILASAAAAPAKPPAAPRASTPQHTDTDPLLVFDGGRSRFLAKSSSGEWNPVDKKSAETLLVLSGMDTFKDESSTNAVERAIALLQRESPIVYAGPLAGHRAGFIGRNVLVTVNCRPLEGVPGECQRILNFIFNLVGADDIQYWLLLLWIKLRREAIAKQRWRAGHALVLVGPRNCGKTILQSRILTPLFGGRIAKPYRYMSGETPFNGDHFSAEHLVIDDEAPGRDINSRRAFGNNLKAMLFSPDQSCHAKGRDAITLRPIWALSCCFNDEPENLQVLPPMEDSMRDKFLVIKCVRKSLTLTEGRKSEYDEYDAILTEVPALAAFIDGLTVPDDMSEPRTGLKHYQHPAIMEELGSISPEIQIDDLIGDVLFTTDISSAWTGSASALENTLLESPRQRDARHLIPNVNRLGVYLNRLCQQLPERYSYTRVKTKRVWKIQPPER
jgi:hypothetical protein